MRVIKVTDGEVQLGISGSTLAGKGPQDKEITAGEGWKEVGMFQRLHVLGALNMCSIRACADPIGQRG